MSGVLIWFGSTGWMLTALGGDLNDGVARFLLTILMTGYLRERKRLAESEQVGILGTPVTPVVGKGEWFEGLNESNGGLMWR